MKPHSILLPRTAFSLVAGESFVSAVIPIPDEDTSSIKVRVMRPAASNGVAWDADSTIKVYTDIMFDGKDSKFRCRGSAAGGRVTPDGRENERYIHNFFMMAGAVRGKGNPSARVEIKCVAGYISSDFDVLGYALPAPERRGAVR